MKLSGKYSFEELSRALQGNFSCQQVTKNSRGEQLGDNEYVSMELFFLRFDFYPKKNVTKIYTVSEDAYGQKTLKPLVTIGEN